MLLVNETVYMATPFTMHLMLPTSPHERPRGSFTCTYDCQSQTLRMCINTCVFLPCCCFRCGFQKLWHPDIAAVLEGAVPMTRASRFHRVSSTWQHYEEVTLPDGLLSLLTACATSTQCTAMA